MSESWLLFELQLCLDTEQHWFVCVRMCACVCVFDLGVRCKKQSRDRNLELRKRRTKMTLCMVEYIKCQYKLIMAPSENRMQKDGWMDGGVSLSSVICEDILDMVTGKCHRLSLIYLGPLHALSKNTILSPSKCKHRPKKTEKTWSRKNCKMGGRKNSAFRKEQFVDKKANISKISFPLYSSFSLNNVCFIFAVWMPQVLQTRSSSGFSFLNFSLLYCLSGWSAKLMQWNWGGL